MSRVPGKTVGYQTYVHVSAISAFNVVFQTLLSKATEIAGVLPNEHFNIVRFDEDQSRVSLLFYADFFDAPFPELQQSWLVDIAAGTFTYRTYENSQNPPILHRKELLLSSDHPRANEYLELTQSAESIGLFDNPTSIGFREQWNQLIRDKGYRIVAHQLIPIGNDESIGEVHSAHDGIQSSFGTIPRHLTALVRYGFSAPVQTLARHGFLKEEKFVFDYGCGRGDDIRGLTENGLQASGWDPHFAPDNTITPAHIVNLGFVINVIENLEERTTALRRAYELSNELLVVAAMLANQNEIEGQRYADGIVTKRGTFQKYYTQTELKIFIEQTLAEEAIAVGPGIFYVFKDKDAEQRFLSERYRSRRTVLRQASRPSVERTPRVRRDRAEEKYQEFFDVLERLWEQWLALGREPEPSEVTDLLRITEGFGTLRKALRFIASRKDLSILEQARNVRIADLEVYFALNQFEKRKPYRHLELGLQRDIKAFFGDYKAAQQAARDLLFRIAESAAISGACEQAAERGLGWLVQSESLQFHTSVVEQLPPILRIYVGCATVLYGDYREADLIKIHIRSGKLTMMRFDDFAGLPLPRMIERVKIKLREQDIDYYAYGEIYPPPYIYNKSRFINEEFANYPEQVAFDRELGQLNFFDLSGYGPSPESFNQTLEEKRWMIDGFQLLRTNTIPDLNALCGRYLTYRDLIECGETQEKENIQNLPKNPDSYTALYELALNILDPVIEYFGMIKLTYGFCSTELAKHIPGRIAPKLDQHAAHEKKKSGEFICDRLGAAIDFIVENEDMLEVAEWVASNTRFDRLYYYGTTRPIHVSYSPNYSRTFVSMRPLPNGKTVPEVRQTKRESNKKF
jgi:DNA phosphorothioation-associated putative methyltransferase